MHTYRERQIETQRETDRTDTNPRMAIARIQGEVREVSGRTSPMDLELSVSRL